MKRELKRDRKRSYVRAVVEMLEPRLLMDDSSIDDVWGTVVDVTTSVDTTVDTQPYDSGSSDSGGSSDSSGSGDSGDSGNMGDNSDSGSSNNDPGSDYSYDNSGGDDSSGDQTDYTVYAPDAPYHVTAQAVSGTSVYVSWKESAGEADGFLVSRSGPDGVWQTIANLGGGTTHYLDSGLQPGTMYTYSVQAYNSGGYSDYSALAGVVTVDTSDPTFVGQFGQIVGGSGVSAPLTIQDGDGTSVTFALSGPGMGVLHLDADGYDLDVMGTTTSSGLTISTVKGRTVGDDGRFDLANLTVGDESVAGDHTGLGTLTARTTDLTGDLTITGDTRSLSLGNLLGQDDVLTIGGPASGTSRGVAMSLGQVGDATVNSAVGITSLTATRWGGGEITAPYMNALNVTGLAARTGSVAGDFGAGLELSGNGVSARSYTLGSVRVAGAVGGTTWDVHGKVGTVVISGTVGESGEPFMLEDAGSVGALNLGVVNDATLGDMGSPLGQIGSITSKAWTAGSLDASTLGVLYVTGVRAGRTTPGVDGDLGADLRLYGVAKQTTTLGAVIVGNQITGGTWQIAGGVGAITAKSVAALSLTVNDSGSILGNLNSLTLSDVKATSTGLVVNANSVLSVNVLGNVSGATIDLRQGVSRSRQALGRLTVRGQLIGSEIWSAGNIGAVSVGVMDHTEILAGVNDGVIGLPAGVSDFVSSDPKLLPTIGSLVVTGATVTTGSPVWIDADVAAGAITKAVLPNKTTAVLDEDLLGRFGFATVGGVKSYVGPASGGNFVSGKDSVVS